MPPAPPGPATRWATGRPIRPPPAESCLRITATVIVVGLLYTARIPCPSSVRAQVDLRMHHALLPGRPDLDLAVDDAALADLVAAAKVRHLMEPGQRQQPRVVPQHRLEDALLRAADVALGEMRDLADDTRHLADVQLTRSCVSVGGPRSERAGGRADPRRSGCRTCATVRRAAAPRRGRIAPDSPQPAEILRRVAAAAAVRAAESPAARRTRSTSARQRATASPPSLRRRHRRSPRTRRPGRAAIPVAPVGDRARQGFGCAASWRLGRRVRAAASGGAVARYSSGAVTAARNASVGVGFASRRAPSDAFPPARGPDTWGPAPA